MSPAIDALQMKDDNQLIGLLNGSLTTLTVPDSVTSIRSNAFTDMSNLKTININKDYNGISGMNWGATNATVNWLKGTKYPITIIQSPNETITVTVDGKSYTESFEYYKGATLTATATPTSGYKAGALSASSVTVSGPVAFTIGEATKLQMQVGTKFVFNKNDNMGPIGLVVRGTTYVLNGDNASSKPLFTFSNDNFSITIKYDLSIIPPITDDLFDGGTLDDFFNSCDIKLTIESNGIGVIWHSNGFLRRSANSAEMDLSNMETSSRSYNGKIWQTTSLLLVNTDNVWSNLTYAYNNGENLVVEFIAK